MAENKSGEEYLWGIAKLAAKNASEAAHVAAEVDRKSEQPRTLRCETGVNREVERAKRSFQIPTYSIRLKVDMYIRNRDDAHRRFIADTRANVKNFKEGGLSDQRIHAVSNKTLLSIVKDRSPSFPHKTIDELKLTKDVLDEACTREQTADGVPNEAFEALIDLLTSDGIDEAPPGTSTIPWARVTAEGAALRDESGRLDFEKICSMFEGQNHAESQGGMPVAAGELDKRVLDSLEGGAQTDVNNRRDNVEDTNISKANPVTATVQDAGPDRSEYPDVDGTIPSNDAPPPRHVLTTPCLFDNWVAFLWLVLGDERGMLQHV
ncbi:hypothetical protein PISMIDRAFT_15384 [Pisolithus microcarpus 441]|uniref:Uncharacterized protein n=1 Tax=Pisolithus microcarpus 441 TaxID=765257 RepID=A0A0C9XXA8_9AGAM|nr:hypothetical protein BKA83DRAFT_15384 [Pisolithus microcarpus]KIK17125.1 hypothetical protein PISMIDRAFT_15384 [Pisolithus microcarpus 441]